MHWYIVYLKYDHMKLIDFLNKDKDVHAFIPKVEKWYSFGKGDKRYIIKELYKNYIFIKSYISHEMFMDKYIKYINIASGSMVLSKKDIICLNNKESQLFSHIYEDGEIVKHSIGNIVNKKLKCEKGPMVGLEDRVIKIDRHHREATLKFDFLDTYFLMPVEIIAKS